MKGYDMKKLRTTISTMKYIEQGVKWKWVNKRISTGGTCDAEYCYSVYLRHLINYYELKHSMPRIVVEFGPGDTIGIGVMALLCGAEKYYALDYSKYAGMHKLDFILERLIYMLRERKEIPGDSVYPGVYPKLKSYQFPDYILSDIWMEKCLSRERIATVKEAVQQVKRGNQSKLISYIAPWQAEETVGIKADFVYSQAVFEHIDEYKLAHKVIGDMLEPEGVVSHQIDFGCHGCAECWNGHLAYNRLIWKLVYGTRPYFLNRVPLSSHIKEMQKSGIHLKKCLRFRGRDGITREMLSRDFTKINDKDFETWGAYIIGIKKGNP